MNCPYVFFDPELSVATAKIARVIFVVEPPLCGGSTTALILTQG